MASLPVIYRNVMLLVSAVLLGFLLSNIVFRQEDPTPSLQVDMSLAAKVLPEFQLKDIYGEQRSISEWSGQYLLINFWATWCAPCIREMPLLQTLHQQRKRHQLQVIGIAIDRTPDVQSFVAEAGVNYPILVGQEDAMAVSDLFGQDIPGLPFSVLSDAHGNILTIHVGEIDAGELRDMVAITDALQNGEIDLVESRRRFERL
ncbi:MAG: TlpA family protein disulfide reductase [Gammaproteobacteria bacterium]